MIAVIAHDAGGAEILSSYVRQQQLICRYALAGPARAIFERKLGPIEVAGIEDAIRPSVSILCGSSWQSMLELDAIAYARSMSRPSVVFLDHWVNYRERFLRLGELCLPDEIWVGDDIAQAMASALLPSLPIRLVDNPYFQDIRRELADYPSPRQESPDKVSVLYVAEPVAAHALQQFGDARYWGYVEEDALRYFLDHVAMLGPVERIVIRPHPSEAHDKYQWAQREFNLPIERGGVRPLSQEVMNSDVVVGCESMAMIVGLIAGKRVVSCIPPGGQACRLPHPQIEHCQQLVNRLRATTSAPVSL